MYNKNIFKLKLNVIRLKDVFNIDNMFLSNGQFICHFNLDVHSIQLIFLNLAKLQSKFPGIMSVYHQLLDEKRVIFFLYIIAY